MKKNYSESNIEKAVSEVHKTDGLTAHAAARSMVYLPAYYMIIYTVSFPKSSHKLCFVCILLEEFDLLLPKWLLFTKSCHILWNKVKSYNFVFSTALVYN